MRRKLLLFLILIVTIFNQTYAGELKLGYNFKTGDKQLELKLNKLNIKAKADMKNFIKELSVEYQTPEVKIQAMISNNNMQPAEAYMALQLQELSHQPLEEVVEEYEENKGKGWGVIAKNLGIKPGSPEFHALKKGKGGMLDDKKSKKTKKSKKDDDDDDDDNKKGKGKKDKKGKDKKGKGKGRGKNK